MYYSMAMLTTLTPAYGESFVKECLDHGLSVKQAAVLLWRQRMDEAMERPSFSNAFLGELQKQAEDAAPSSSIWERMDSSLADKGGVGANMGHYAGRGAIGGGILAALPSLFGRKGKGIGKILGSLGKRVALGTGIGAAGGAGYGVHKSIANRLSIDPKALNLSPQISTGNTESVHMPNAGHDIYSRDGETFSSDGDSPTNHGAVAGSQGSSGAVSDYVRKQQTGIDSSDKRIADLTRNKQTFRRTGNPAADYAQSRQLDEAIAAEQKSRDSQQKTMNSSLGSLKTQQQVMNRAIDKRMPYVREREQYFERMGHAADAGHRRNWLSRKLINWVGGTNDDYDPVWDYKVNQGRAQDMRRNMEQSLQNPPIYR